MAQSQALVAECPTCSAVVSIDATECPECGEQFEPEAAPERSAGRGIGVDEDTADDEETEEKSGFREKFLFYTGIFLILLGGPGIALGSWLHDLLRIPVQGYTAYDTFGPFNRLVTAIGLIVLIVGIVLLILSLRFSRPTDVEKDLRALHDS
jgi:hypothetical protein